MKTVGVITQNDFLFQKIRLALKGSAVCLRQTAYEPLACDVCLFDLDTEHSTAPDGALTLSRTKACSLRVPFLISELYKAIEEKGAADAIMLDRSKKEARVGENSFKLTELELELLALLLSERRFFSKAEILERVWHGEADEGIVNVYVHYLREKLEGGKERIILSARNKGYSINEKFLTRGGR